MVRSQRTLKKEIAFSGIGLHTGKEVLLRLLPSQDNSGIVFQRVDLPGKPFIPASVEYVQDTSRSTKIGIGEASVQTIEHLLAAIYACQVDNVCIQVNEGEPPIADGSAQPFIELIEKTGVVEQKSLITKISLQKPVFVSHKEAHLVALPSHEFRISYTLHYPKSSVIGSQYLSLEISEDSFKKELALSRTFALYEEISILMERGLIRGGSLENGVVIKDNAVFSKDGLRYPNEMVRHKILDLVGDLALVGFSFNAHIIAIRSGHAANVALGKEILNSLSFASEEA